MTTFTAQFKVVYEHNCPFYRMDNWFILTDKSISYPRGRPSCLILVRELTNLLIALTPHVETGFAEQRDEIFSCGGCTGLIKFQLGDPPEGQAESESSPPDDDNAVIMGRIDAISPAELLQVFHMHQKTGNLLFDVPAGRGRVSFREGALIAARFGEMDSLEAIFALLRENAGRFRFVSGLSAPLMEAGEIGDFMMILMEGLKHLDETE